jgi:hypothetical protein
MDAIGVSAVSGLCLRVVESMSGGEILVVGKISQAPGKPEPLVVAQFG